MKQTRENDKKPFFFLNLKFKNFKFFFVGFTSTRGQKFSQAIIVCNYFKENI